MESQARGLLIANLTIPGDISGMKQRLVYYAAYNCWCDWWYAIQSGSLCRAYTDFVVLAHVRDHCLAGRPSTPWPSGVPRAGEAIKGLSLTSRASILSFLLCSYPASFLLPASESCCGYGCGYCLPSIGCRLRRGRCNSICEQPWSLRAYRSIRPRDCHRQH